MSNKTESRPHNTFHLCSYVRKHFSFVIYCHFNLDTFHIHHTRSSLAWLYSFCPSRAPLSLSKTPITPNEWASHCRCGTWLRQWVAGSRLSQHWHTGKEADIALMIPLSLNDYKIFHIQHTISEESKKKVGVERWCCTNALFCVELNIPCKQTVFFRSLCLHRDFFSLGEPCTWPLGRSGGHPFTVHKTSHLGCFHMFPIWDICFPVTRVSQLP